MSTTSGRTFVRRRRAAVAAALVGLAGLAAGAAGSALAQPDSLDDAGAEVAIEAAGERVRAAGATVTVTGSAAAIRAAGATVRIRADVEGGLRAAGAKVDVDATVGGDTRVAGASVDVSGTIGNDMDIAGAVVVVNAAVGGRLRAGGATVTVSPGSDIAGELQAGAASLRVSGHIGGPVKIGGALVTFNARADGDVEISGDRVVIGAPARIGGDLIVRSRLEPEIDEGAEIAGETRRLQPPQWWWPISPWARAAAFAAFVAAGTILAGIVMMLFSGRAFAVAANHVRLRPGSSLLIGLATAILVPVVAGLVMVTVIGVTTGVAILLIMPFLVVFGHAVAAAGIATGIFVRDRGENGALRSFVLLIVGAIIVALVWVIPWVGGLLGAIVLLFGIGALTRTLGGRIRRAEPPPAVPAAA